MTQRPTHWPCGCHGWGWRHHDGHCCITDLHRDTDDPPCHMHIWDEFVKRAGRTPHRGDHAARDTLLREITLDLYPGFAPTTGTGPGIIGDLIPPSPALPPLGLDEFGTAPLPID